MGKFFKYIKQAIAFVMLYLPFIVNAQTSEWYTNNERAIDSLRKGEFWVEIIDSSNNHIEANVTYSLKKHEFPWGTALSSPDMHSDYWYAATARKFFNNGVTENAFKWSEMQPNNVPVNYDDVDHYLNWCESVGWEMRGHALLWGSKDYEDFHPLQKWVKDLPIPEMYDECKLRVQREMEYYKGRIKDYDVLNEAIPGHANWLQQTVGDSINWNSFKWASEADSNAKLFINDYNVISYSEYDKYIEVIQAMLDNGAPLDGIGVQSHFDAVVNHKTMKARLDSLARFGLPIKITEFDLQVGKNNISEVDQAKYTANAMRTAFAHSSVNGFIFWGFWDERHWRDKGGMFSTNKQAKIAADSVFNLIHITWNTSGFQTVSSTIPLEVNGYFGEYEFEIEYEGQKRVVDASLLKEFKNDTIRVVFENGIPPAPKLTSAIAFEESTIRLYFDSKILIDAENANQFKVYSSNLHEINSIWQPEHDSTQVILELSDKVNYRHNLTVSYFPGTVKGANGSILDFIGVFPIENRIPGFLSGASNEVGEIINIQFSRLMAEPNADDLAAFEITVDGEIVSLSDIGLVADDANQIYLELSEPVLFGEQVKLSYAPGNIQSADNGLLSSFGPKLVTNNVLPTSASNLMDKNNLRAYYSRDTEELVLENKSINKTDHFYRIFNVAGVELYQGLIKSGETKRLNTLNINSQIVLIRFANLNRNLSFNRKIIITK